MADWETMGAKDGWETVGSEPAAKSGVAGYIEKRGQDALSVVDTALSLGSGAIAPAVAGIAGLAGSVLPGSEGQGARTVQRVQDALTYEPKTPMGKAVTGAVAYPFQKLAEGADAAGGKVAEKTGSPLAGTAVNTAIQALPMGLAPVLKRVGPIKSAAEKNPPKVAANVEAAKDAGYRITPEEAGAGPISRAAASLSGEPKLAKLNSKKNQALHNEFIADDLGLPKDTTLDRATLKKIRDDAGADYEAVKTTGKVTTDAQYVADLDAIVKSHDMAARDFAHRSENPFQKTLDGLKVREFDAASAVEEVKLLRKDADKAYATRDSGLGRAYKASAEALDNMLLRHVQQLATTSGNPAVGELVKNYQGARTRIAKSYAAEKALNEATGDINAQAYAKALEKGAQLSGGAQQVGEFARAFPRSSQKPSSMPTGPTLADAWTAMGAAHFGGLGAFEAATVARPITRSVLSSKAGQALMRPKNWSATELARQIQANRGVAGAETSQGQRDD